MARHDDDDDDDDVIQPINILHDTIKVLLNIADDINECLHNTELVFHILIDYFNAFDCARHRVILVKLNTVSFQNYSLAWIVLYLHGWH